MERAAKLLKEKPNYSIEGHRPGMRCAGETDILQTVLEEIRNDSGGL